MPNCRAKRSAFVLVRFATVSWRAPARNSGATMPRLAPPAPTISVRAPAKSQPKLARKSRTKPAPSVLQPRLASPSTTMVFTAPLVAAAASWRSTQRQACSLKGTVTFKPLPPSPKKDCAAAANPSSGACSLP